MIRNLIRLPIAPQGRCNKMLLSLMRVNRHNMIYILSRRKFIKLPVNLTKQKTEAQVYSVGNLPQKFANPVNLYNHY